MITTNLFVIANVKQLRTGGSFGILLPFFRTSWGVGFLNSTIFNSFKNRIEFGTILEGFQNFGRGFETPTSPLGTPLSDLRYIRCNRKQLCMSLKDARAVKSILLLAAYACLYL